MLRFFRNRLPAPGNIIINVTLRILFKTALLLQLIQRRQ